MWFYFSDGHEHNFDDHGHSHGCDDDHGHSHDDHSHENGIRQKINLIKQASNDIQYVFVTDADKNKAK